MLMLCATTGAFVLMLPVTWAGTAVASSVAQTAIGRGFMGFSWEKGDESTAVAPHALAEIRRVAPLGPCARDARQNDRRSPACRSAPRPMKPDPKPVAPSARPADLPSLRLDGRTVLVTGSS